MSSLTKTCRQLLAYTLWADRVMLEAMSEMSEDDRLRDTGTSYRSVQGTMAHSLGAQWTWLSRFLGSPLDRVPGIESYGDLDSLRAGFEELWPSLEAFLAGLTEQQLADQLAWANTRGEAHRHPLWGAVIHMVNHSSYHRGQVVSMLRQLGYVPPSTDLIYFLLDRSPSPPMD